MSKFNTQTVKAPAGNTPISTRTDTSIPTALGAPGYARTDKSELFMLGLANMVGEDTFHELAAARDARYAALARRVAVDDVSWLTRFVRWLRRDIGMRSAPLVAAAEGVRARHSAGLTGGGRWLVDAALDRADEPGEILAYWITHYGRRLPMATKKGAGDAALRLYRQYQLIKYDTPAHNVRWADVLELCHPAGRRGGPVTDALFTYALDRRHGNATVGDGQLRGPDESLAMVRAYEELLRLADGDPQQLLDARLLSASGITWNTVLSLAGDRVPKVKLWEALIPLMPLRAQVKNLRNFDEAGVADEYAEFIIGRLGDPEHVRRAKMFPYELLAAYRNTPSDRWKHPLGKAVDASLANLPALRGRTLILVDLSQSMTWKTISAKSTMQMVDAAVLFGVALAARNDADLVGFASVSRRHQLTRGASILRESALMLAGVGTLGGSTNVAGAVREHYNRHDRVVIISDEQTADVGVGDLVPPQVPLYGFNLSGYRPAMAEWGTRNRIQLGGLSDAMFQVLPMIERGQHADWPF